MEDEAATAEDKTEVFIAMWKDQWILWDLANPNCKLLKIWTWKTCCFNVIKICSDSYDLFN